MVRIYYTSISLEYFSGGVSVSIRIFLVVKVIGGSLVMISVSLKFLVLKLVWLLNFLVFFLKFVTSLYQNPTSLKGSNLTLIQFLQFSFILSHNPPKLRKSEKFLSFLILVKISVVLLIEFLYKIIPSHGSSKMKL